MNIHRKPKKDQFSLKEVKSTKRDSLEINAKSTIVDGVESYKIPYNGNYPIIPHPDIFDQFDLLKTRLASEHGYTMFEALVGETKFEASVSQKKYVEDLTKQLLDQIKVSGISFAGKERSAIVIKGTFNGSAINTRPLHFKNQEYGEEIREIADQIEDEVFAYLFEEKKAQLEAFTGGEVDGKAAASGDS